MKTAFNMKSVLFFSILFLPTGILKNTANLAEEEDPGMTVEEFYRKVNVKDKLVLVYFHADWCVPCIKLQPAIEQITNEEKETVMVLSLDADQNPAITTHFEINTLPLFMIFKNGKKVWENNTAMSKNNLVDKLNLYREKKN